MDRNSVFAATLAASLAALGVVSSAHAAELPKSTQAMLKELKLPESVLAGLDKELTVPADWVGKAKKEGKLIIGSTWDLKQFQKMSLPFRERYPGIDIQYSRSSYNNRVVKTLIAWKEGRVLTDIVTGFGGGYFLFRDANALEDLRGLPGFGNPVAGGTDPNGMWVGSRLRYWCMAYNTNAVKKEDLPKTWDDLVTNSRLHGRKIAVGNRPQLWLLMLWGKNGPEWTTQFMKAFVERVQPQFRKEGTNALIALNIAGEFQATIPSAAYRIAQYKGKGAPISWHCPEPVPLAISEMGIVKNSPNAHAAKLFVNWFLSKEGQIAQFSSDRAPPVHKELQDANFLAFPGEIVGKKIAFRHPELESQTEQMLKVWDPLWAKFSGEVAQKPVKMSVVLDAVQERGREIAFKHQGKAVKVGVSGSRTKLTIGGKKVSRSALKAGMACEVVAAQGAAEAVSVACK